MADAHSSIITLFSDTTKALSDVLAFGYGAGDDFNSIKNKKYPTVWVDPITGSFDTKDSQVGDTIRWTISVNFVEPDTKAANEQETARVWSSMFKLMEEWLHKLDQSLVNPEVNDETRISSAQAEIQAPSFRNRRKITKDLASGWNLTFTFITQSDFDYCTIYE